MHDILDMMPEGIKQNKSKTILQHLSEAWYVNVHRFSYIVLPTVLFLFLLHLLTSRSAHCTLSGDVGRRTVSHDTISSD